MSFPRYPKYKPSRVEWLGDVPEHWDVVPCRGIVRERTAKNVDGSCEDYLSLMANVGIIPYAEKGDVGNKKPEDLSKCKLVKKGDFVINSMNYGIGSYGVSAYDGICSPVYIVMTPQREIVEPRFAFRIFEDRAFQTYAQSFGNGILEHRCAINWDILKVIDVAVPPRDEQRTLLGFLDRETSKIDSLVGEQRRLIELLKEKRQAVISHAVTKGLNPQAPLKPSGIQWLGDVPEHWETRTIAKASTKITNGYVGPTRDILVESGTPYIQATHIKNGRVNFDDGYFVTQSWSQAHAKSILAEGDVLIVQTGAGTGDVGLVSANEVGFNCHALIIIASERDCLSGEYLAAVLQSDYGRQRLESIQTGGMHPHLNCGNVKYVEIPIPPIDEQAAIVGHIRAASDRFDALTAEAERAIELLQQRRTALISAAVTGKIDVREFAAV